MSQLIWKRRKWGEITAGNAGEDESGDDSGRIAAGNGRAEAAGGSNPFPPSPSPPNRLAFKPLGAGPGMKLRIRAVTLQNLCRRRN